MCALGIYLWCWCSEWSGEIRSRSSLLGAGEESVSIPIFQEGKPAQRPHDLPRSLVMQREGGARALGFCFRVGQGSFLGPPANLTPGGSPFLKESSPGRWQPRSAGLLTRTRGSESGERRSTSLNWFLGDTEVTCIYHGTEQPRSLGR